MQDLAVSTCVFPHCAHTGLRLYHSPIFVSLSKVLESPNLYCVPLGRSQSSIQCFSTRRLFLMSMTSVMMSEPQR